MFRFISFLSVCLLIFLGSSVQVFSCTIFVLVTDGNVYFGNNEDYIKAGAVTFVPASEGKYGRVNFGFHGIFEIENFAQGSMNEKGLAFDAAVVASIPWKADPEKKEFKGNLIDHIMDTCKSIEEVEKKFKTFNCKYLSMSQFLFADSSGQSVLVSWEPKKGVLFTRRQGKFQVATNHRQCFSSYRCQRNIKVSQVLSADSKDPVEQVRNALKAVHQEGKNFTSYSNIFDLKKKRILLFNLSNFEEVVEFELAKELSKGKRQIRLNQIFKKSPKLREMKARKPITSFGTEVKIDPKSLANYSGQYQPDGHPEITITVESKENRLIVHTPGKPDVILIPEGKSLFRIHPDKGQVSFKTSTKNSADEMIIHKQKDMVLKKISSKQE